ncbi:MAG TPA: RidA family protein [Candidatus Sulfotelmatobacter sp.]|nr:RidA family protein [Candidatus Sulfotelmatobacter sp.]
MPRKTLHFLLMIFGVMLIAVFAGPASQAQEHKAINLGSASGLPFSDGIVAGNTLYIAGQEGSDEGGKLASGGIAAETKAALANIEKVVKAAGFEMKDIVSVTVYLSDIHDFPEMNKVYKGVMPDPKPARATIQAAALVNNAKVEIAAIAVKQK